ncbi:MAG: nucleotidyltransferase domain-containing protein [Bacillota bacterium]
MTETREKLRSGEVLQRLRDLGELDTASVIVLGSVARGRQTPNSDIDFLVLTKSSTRRWVPPIDVHLHLETRDEFLSRLRRGEDFEAWAVRFGVTVSDPSGWWESTRLNPDLRRIWPDWRNKVDQAEKRRRLAEQLLEDGDIEGAAEEYLMSASHLARAVLQKAGVFPLSRPEMPGQLDVLGQADLSRALTVLADRPTEAAKLRAVVPVVDKYLLELQHDQLACAATRQ